MRLIRGASGSGKTALVFREFKAALRTGRNLRDDLRIVVPTATLVRHYQHELARSGLVFDPRMVVSLSRYAVDCAAQRPLIPAGLLRALLRDALSRLRLPEFAEAAATPGMTDVIIETITLFENADCTPDRLSRARGLSTQGKAFLRVWQEVDAAIAARGFATRGQVIRSAAAATLAGTVWIDGFLKFSPLERGLVRAIASNCELTLTLTDTPATDDVRRFATELGAQDRLLPRTARFPKTLAVSAPSPEREADEIARRVLRLNAEGCDFPSIAVALRDVDTWLPLLRTTFDRFGIPARYYFSTPVRQHPVAGFLGGLIRCALDGWEFEPTLAALRAHPAWGRSADFDRFDFRVREAMPGRGAAALLGLCESDWLQANIADCLRIESWREERARPSVWRRRLEQFAERLYRVRTVPAPADYAAVETARSHAAGLRAWSTALDVAASFWPDDAAPVFLKEFYSVVHDELETGGMQVPDDRHNVVHVMSAFEARQWQVRALFVCGLTARDYPRHRAQNLLFSDSELERLRGSGIPLRTAADDDRDEDLLFESLRTRATESLVLTVSGRDAGGQTILPSRHFTDASSAAFQVCRPAARYEPATPGVAGVIAEPSLAGLAAQHLTVSLTALEDLAKCRFRFFAGRSLSLKGVPDRPSERLQPRVTGLIFHEAMQDWLADRTRDFVELFEKAFDEGCRKRHIPAGYRVEVERVQFRRIARDVSATAQWPIEFSETEVDCSIAFPGGVTVNCRVDRIDHVGAGNCVIVDYKSGKTANVDKLVESETSLQGPLYALAVREKKDLNPVAMVFLAIREGRPIGWGEIPESGLELAPMPPNWIDDAKARTVARLEGYLAGDVRVLPNSRDDCRWCDFSDACRIETQETAPLVVKIGAAGGNKFTADQLRAVDYRALDVCVVAGPGSGKTTVLVERYRRLVEEHQFDPRHILAITFTEKAAANMKAKLAALFRHNPVRLRDLESSSWVSTIHGFCMKLLRENAIAAGLDPRFTVLSPRESEKMQWECLQGALDEMTEQRRAETLELIEALHSPRLANELKDVYDAVRSAGLSIEDVRAMENPSPALPPVRIVSELRDLVRQWIPVEITPTQRTEKARLLDWCVEFETAGDPDLKAFLGLLGRLKLNMNRVPGKFRASLTDLRERLEKTKTAAVDRHAAPFRAMIFGVMARFDEEYRKRKSDQGRVDFNDLERHAIALLRNHPDVQARIQKHFRQIMLDEFQDINGQQAELIRMLRAENVFFGVGDGNQSIYGFRHARPEIFTLYQADIAARSAQSAELLHNFRSREAVLRCVRAVMADKDGIDDRELISGANFAAKEEPCIEVLKLGDAADDKEAASDREATWIAHRVQSLCGVLQLGAPGETRAAEFRDFAVLCRSGDSMQPILAAFDRAGIPYVCGRRVSYLLSREGLDITALLRVIANPRDGISLATLLRSPLVGLSDEGLLRLRLLAKSLTGGLSIFATAAVEGSDQGVGEADAGKLTRFRHNLERWRNDQPIVPLDVLLARALADCGVNWSPVTEPGSNMLGANIESFLHLARTMGAGMDLPGFLLEIESLAEAAGMESDLSDEDQGDCVQVMTAHAAKGLEFNITIIAAMDKGPRRESGPVTFTPEHGLGVKWRNPAAEDGKDELKDSWAVANKEIASKREKDEENRLLYVAMTRAAEHLILSYSAGKNRPSNWAKLVDGYFGLHEAAGSMESRRVVTGHQGAEFAASILITDADPPHPAHTPHDSAGQGVETVTRPLLEDQHESSVSVTSLAVFGACPRKYYIQRSLGWNSGRFRRFDPGDVAADDPADTLGDDADLPASRLGSAVHEILAGLTPSDETAEARQLAEVFANSELGRRASASSHQAREWAFIADVDGTIIRGSIDLWFEENGALYVVDYKTDDVTPAAAQARAVEYAPQLALYGLALERAFGKRPSVAWLHFLRPNVVVETALDDAVTGAARSLVAGLRKAQDELRFDLNEGPHCRTCQFYRSLCPAGRAEGERQDA